MCLTGMSILLSFHLVVPLSSLFRDRRDSPSYFLGFCVVLGYYESQSLLMIERVDPDFLQHPSTKKIKIKMNRYLKGFIGYIRMPTQTKLNFQYILSPYCVSYWRLYRKIMMVANQEELHLEPQNPHDGRDLDIIWSHLLPDVLPS